MNQLSLDQRAQMVACLMERVGMNATARAIGASENAVARNALWLSYYISKKIRHKRAALALRFVYENYARVHESLRCTPAMELGVADHVWEIEEIVALMPRRPVNRPKTYKKRSAA